MIKAEEERDEIGKKAIENAIAKLPEMQQYAVQACFDASEKHATQRRYDIEYIYECLLMRIKGSSLYKHIRNREILVLPTLQTLNNYISELQPKYGFQKSVFDAMKLKAGRMNIEEKIGLLTAH